MSEPDPPKVSEAEYKKAEALINEYIDKYHQTIYWYLRRKYHAPPDVVEDVMQELWLHVFQQLTLKRHDQMYKSYLFFKAGWILLDVKGKASEEAKRYMNARAFAYEDQREKMEETIVLEMLRQGRDGDEKAFIRPEPLSDEEEIALFKSFWTEYPTEDLTDEQKEIAFDIFRFGLTLKEISEKREIAISTLSDWKSKIESAVRNAHYNSKEDRS